MTYPLYYIPDTFLNRYDADDTAVKLEPSVQDFPPEPVQIPAPNNTSAFTSGPKQEPNDEELGNIPVKDEPMYGNGQNGDTGPSWSAGQANGGNAHQYNDAAMEQEPAPIGIKEDG